MDPLTHFMTGACMSRAGFNRKTALATLTMTLAAEAADLDIVWGFKGSIAELQHHRGITHSFIGAPFVAAAVVLFVWIIHRLRKRKLANKNTASSPPLRWGLLFWLALLAALSHILLDYTTAYGIRMFAPFNWRWYSWDIVSIIDPIIWAVLILGLVMPSLFNLINQEIGARSRGPRGRGGAIFALVCLVLLWGLRDFQHRRALDAMNSITYRGEAPVRMGAYPYFLDPFQWHGVVETADFFESVPVHSLGPQVDPDSQGVVRYKSEETPVTQAAKSSYLGRVYLDWAAFPVLDVQKVEGAFRGFLVQFEDLRYDYPDSRGRPPLSGYVVLGLDLRVQDEGMDSRKSPTVESLEHPDRD